MKHIILRITYTGDHKSFFFSKFFTSSRDITLKNPSKDRNGQVAKLFNELNVTWVKWSIKLKSE
jgi:hypothetical protein